MGTNAQRQAAFKERMRRVGKKQIAIWVDPQQEAAITAFLADAAPLPVTPRVVPAEPLHPPEK